MDESDYTALQSLQGMIPRKSSTIYVADSVVEEYIATHFPQFNKFFMLPRNQRIELAKLLIKDNPNGFYAKHWALGGDDVSQGGMFRANVVHGQGSWSPGVKESDPQGELTKTVLSESEIIRIG